jgi:hypothetical protein
MDDLIRRALRGQFVEVSVCFYVGADTDDLLEDIEQMARDNWALRSEDDA